MAVSCLFFERVRIVYLSLEHLYLGSFWRLLIAMKMGVVFSATIMADQDYAARFSSSERSHPSGVTEGLRFC